MTGEPTTVLIADDQRVVREGLTMILGLMPGVEIVGSACDGEQALALVEQLRPDVVLMDLRMPHCDGVEATRRITSSGSDTKVVVLTTYADDHSVIQALRAGACGFLTKDATSRKSPLRWRRPNAANPPSTPLSNITSSEQSLAPHRCNGPRPTNRSSPTD
jgi:DNA-binding NarL/FixJ family response regulator